MQGLKCGADLSFLLMTKTKQVTLTAIKEEIEKSIDSWMYFRFANTGQQMTTTYKIKCIFIKYINVSYYPKAQYNISASPVQ